MFKGYRQKCLSFVTFQSIESANLKKKKRLRKTIYSKKKPFFYKKAQKEIQTLQIHGKK